MHRSAAGVALAVAVLAGACSRGGAGLSPQRENAYRANNLGVARPSGRTAQRIIRAICASE